MTPAYPRHLGLWLIAAVVVPLTAVPLLRPANAQPPGLPGGGIPRPPDFPRIPPIPSPPDIGPRGPRGGSLFEHVWSCSNCRRELGRSDSAFDKPHYSSCPFCGVKFSDSLGWGRRRAGSSFRPSSGGAARGGSGGGGGAGDTTPAPRGPASPSSPDMVNPAGENTEGDAAPAGSRASSGIPLWVIVVGVLALLGVFGVGGLMLLVFFIGRPPKSPGARRRKKRRRREDDDDEFDDEDDDD